MHNLLYRYFVFLHEDSQKMALLAKIFFLKFFPQYTEFTNSIYQIYYSRR
jgi:hypothetical protein